MKIIQLTVTITASIMLAACSPTTRADGLFQVDPIEWQKQHVKKPNTMSIMIGGATGTSYELTYDGRELRYYKAADFFSLEGASPELVRATKKEWGTFWLNLVN